MLNLPTDVAFFIAKRINSNVRELEGALRRVIASARFTGRTIDMAFTKESLRDLLALQDRLVSVDNIQKTVAEYYKIRVADLLSPRRTRSITRPRQIAMALAKELTSHSLPEIGACFWRAGPYYCAACLPQGERIERSQTCALPRTTVTCGEY